MFFSAIALLVSPHFLSCPVFFLFLLGFEAGSNTFVAHGVPFGELVDIGILQHLCCESEKFALLQVYSVD